MDEYSVMLGRHRISGMPYHGRVVGSSLALPNGQTLNGAFHASQLVGTCRLAVPGVAAVSRTPAEAAHDAANGWQWRTDLAVGITGDSRLMLYGRYSLEAHAVYAVGPGRCWAVRLPYSVAMNAEKTQLTTPAAVWNASLVNDGTRQQQDVTVALQGYAGTPHTPYGSYWRAWDISADGAKTILGGSISAGDNYGYYTPYSGYGFGLLRAVGDGSAGSPFQLTIQRLSYGNEAGNEVVNNGITGFSGVYDWNYTFTEQYIPVDGRECPSLKTTMSAPTLSIGPGTPSPNTPAISFESGTREVRLDGLICGWWFGQGGEPEAVTADYRYTLNCDYTASGVGSGTPTIRIVPQVMSYGSCSLDGNDPGEYYPGSFTWTCEQGYVISEELEIVLRVGGAEIDRMLLRYECEQGTGFTGPSATVGDDNNPHPEGYPANTWLRRRLLLNGELVDSITAEGADGGNWAPLPGTPTLGIDRYRSYPGYYGPSSWLLTLAGGEHSLGDGHAVRLRTRVHWPSNRLVCLLTQRQDGPLFKRADTYGPLAYPGGVAGSRVTIPAGAGHAPPRFSALSPFNGQLTLHHAERVSYI